MRDSRNQAILALLLIICLATPGARSLLEREMVSHVLIQIPLLAICGVWVGNYLSKSRQLHIPYHIALPLFLVALFTLMFWMLPRMLDASLEQAGYIAAKFVTLPFLLGIPLALSWGSLGISTKAFVMTNTVSMLAVLAWLYLESPVRLCNYYLADEQKKLGIYLLCILGAVSFYWIAKLFIGPLGKRV